MKDLTDKQRKVLMCIVVYAQKNAYMPALQDIADAFHMTKKGARDHVKALIRKGYLTMDAGVSRSFRVHKMIDGVPVRQEIRWIREDEC